MSFFFKCWPCKISQTLNTYEVSKIVTTCPHCFNVLKNDYPALGGHYEVIHHTQLIQSLIDDGRLRYSGGTFDRKKNYLSRFLLSWQGKW